MSSTLKRMMLGFVPFREAERWEEASSTAAPA